MVDGLPAAFLAYSSIVDSQTLYSILVSACRAIVRN